MEEEEGGKGSNLKEGGGNNMKGGGTIRSSEREREILYSHEREMEEKFTDFHTSTTNKLESTLTLQTVQQNRKFPARIPSKALLLFCLFLSTGWGKNTQEGVDPKHECFPFVS